MNRAYPAQAVAVGWDYDIWLSPADSWCLSSPNHAGGLRGQCKCRLRIFFKHHTIVRR